MPMISTLSPTFTSPRSIRPVATVPRPLMPNTSSIGIRNGLSTARAGVGMYASTASISAQIGALFGSSRAPVPFSSACSALPRTIGMSSPGNWYRESSSRTSSSTSSISSSSSTMSTLFRNTTTDGTSTCRASRMCSRVCGIGPSAALTTRIAPSICAAPVIMFLM